jgi:hypothetical protein
LFNVIVGVPLLAEIWSIDSMPIVATLLPLTRFVEEILVAFAMRAAAISTKSYGARANLDCLALIKSRALDLRSAAARLDGAAIQSDSVLTAVQRLKPKLTAGIPAHNCARTDRAPHTPYRYWSKKEMIMRLIVSALVALSILGGEVASAYAFDAKTFFEQQERWSH